MNGERNDDAIAVDDDVPSGARPSGKRSSKLSERRASRGEVVRQSRQRSSGPSKAGSERKARRNPFVALIQFFREVISELRKVIWPNRKQMVTYTAVVLVFVSFMVAYIGGLDVGFVKAVTWLFG